MKFKSILFIAVVCVAWGSCPAADAASSNLKKMLIGRIEAISRNDTVELTNLCVKNYQLITSTGTKMNMDEVIKTMANQKNQIKSYVILSYQPFIAEDESMAFAISEIEEEIVKDKTILKNNLIVTEVYRKVNKKWKIQLTHVSQKICNFP
jgi:hypothetical protein